MWNSTKYTAMAITAAGLAGAAATPTSAQHWGANGEYVAYGPTPWNQGPSGGPWLRAPWNPAPWLGAVQASWVPPQAVVPESGGAYGCGTARPAFGCGGPRGRAVVWPRRVSAAARSTAAG